MHGGPSIIRRHAVEPSNVELIASLRTNILASQEAAAEEEDVVMNDTVTTDGVSSSSSSSSSSSTLNQVSRRRRPPLDRWISRGDSALYVPLILWSLSGLSEERPQYDITVKLFFLPNVGPSRRRSQTKEAIDLVRKELNVPSIDLLILSFPGVIFTVNQESENGHRPDCSGGSALHGGNTQASSDGGEVEDIGTMVKTWRTVEELQTQGIIGRLGVAEFSSRRLEDFLKHSRVRPSVNQINVRDCCTVPRSLINFAKREGIELLTHNDCTNILPTGTLRDLLGDGKDGVGLLTEPGSTRVDALVGDVQPQWVVKYTAVVRDRGVVENKGYFAGADLEDRRP